MNNQNTRIKANAEVIMLFVAVILSVYKYSYFGFSYTPYLDDYIQYFFYPSFPNPWQTILTGGAGVLFTRPLAGLMDFFVWSRFSENLGVAVIVLSVLYSISGVLFYRTLKACNLKPGLIFLAVYLFAPLSAEGTYWLSASSRIVVSLFLASLSAKCAVSKRYGLFALFNLLSMWFYEQTAVVSFLIAVFLAIELRNKKIAIAAILSVILLAVFYILLGFKGDNSSRLAVARIGDITKNIFFVIKDFLAGLIFVGGKIAIRGFLRGFQMVAADFSLLWIGVLTVLAVIFLNLSHYIDHDKDLNEKKLAVGIVLAVAPLIPFVITKGNGLNLRNIVPSLLGVAIVLDNALSSVFKKHTGLVASVLIFCFSVATVSEVYDYNYTAKQDYIVAQKISDSVKSESKHLLTKINLPDYYPQNVPWRDHIKSMKASDWGVTGIVRTISGNKRVVIENKK